VWSAFRLPATSGSGETGFDCTGRDRVLGASADLWRSQRGGFVSVMRAIQIPQISRMTTKNDEGPTRTDPEPKQRASGDVLESPQVEKQPRPNLSR
jgi:hypothetical protein